MVIPIILRFRHVLAKVSLCGTLGTLLWGCLLVGSVCGQGATTSRVYAYTLGGRTRWLGGDFNRPHTWPERLAYVTWALWAPS